MALSFTIRKSFSPSHSALGRFIRWRTADRLRAEAIYIFVVTMAVVAWLLIDFAAWALLAERIEAEPTGQAAILFFVAQLGVPLLGIVVAGIGFRPEVHVLLEDDRLSVTAGSERVDVSLDETVTIRTIGAVEYHRGLRLMASTRPFINRPVDRVVVIAAPDMTVALGLSTDDRETLLAAMPVTATAEPPAPDERQPTASSRIMSTDPTP